MISDYGVQQPGCTQEGQFKPVCNTEHFTQNSVNIHQTKSERHVGSPNIDIPDAGWNFLQVKIFVWDVQDIHYAKCLVSVSGYIRLFEPARTSSACIRQDNSWVRTTYLGMQQLTQAGLQRSDAMSAAIFGHWKSKYLSTQHFQNFVGEL